MMEIVKLTNVFYSKHVLFDQFVFNRFRNSIKEQEREEEKKPLSRHYFLTSYSKERENTKKEEEEEIGELPCLHRIHYP